MQFGKGLRVILPCCVKLACQIDSNIEYDLKTQNVLNLLIFQSIDKKRYTLLALSEILNMLCKYGQMPQNCEQVTQAVFEISSKHYSIERAMIPVSCDTAELIKPRE